MLCLFLLARVVPGRKQYVKREDRIEQVVEFVKGSSEPVSVSDIAEALELSYGYVRGLAVEASEKGFIHGEKSAPVVGYIFNRQGRTRTDGGDREGELRVLPSREALLQAVRDHAPHRYEEAASKTLDELRKFVRKQVADGTTTVSHAWRFS